MPPLGSTWRKSTHSGTTGACVEVRYVDRIVQVRDSKDPDGPTLAVRPDAWAAFLAGHPGAERCEP